MDWRYLFTRLEGRIGRKPYWLASIVLVLVLLVLQFIIAGLLGVTASIVFCVLASYFSFALTVKRGHDRNRPGWYVGVFYLMAIALNIWQFAGVDMEDPGTLFLALSVAFLIFALVLMIDLGFLRGTPGPNRYGQDPLAP